VSDENNFLMQAAAEKAIADLQAQATAAAEAAATAKNAAESTARSAKRWKILTAVLAVVVLLCGYVTWQQHNSTNQLRQQAIASCEIGNDRAAGTVTALDELVILLEGPHPTADVQRRAAAYDTFVAQHNPQRNCQQAYGH
jgi:hypothetical protein